MPKKIIKHRKITRRSFVAWAGSTALIGLVGCGKEVDKQKKVKEPENSTVVYEKERTHFFPLYKIKGETLYITRHKTEYLGKGDLDDYTSLFISSPLIPPPLIKERAAFYEPKYTIEVKYEKNLSVCLILRAISYEGRKQIKYAHKFRDENINAKTFLSYNNIREFLLCIPPHKKEKASEIEKRLIGKNIYKKTCEDKEEVEIRTFLRTQSIEKKQFFVCLRRHRIFLEERKSEWIEDVWIMRFAQPPNLTDVLGKREPQPTPIYLLKATKHSLELKGKFRNVKVF